MRPGPRSLLLTAGAAGAIIVTGCAAPSSGNPQIPAPDPDRNVVHAFDERLVNSHTRFGFNLFDVLRREEPGENLFISPASVAFALAMTYNGAEGETKEAMARALEMAGLSMEEINSASAAWLESLTTGDPEVQLALANSLWIRDGVPVIAEFVQRNADYYGADVGHLDFSDPEAADVINAWVREHTNERIEEIVEAPIDALTFMFLINALYFQGTWTDQFDEDFTRDGDFTLPDGTTVSVPMMSQDTGYRLLKGDGFEAIALPYGKERFSMYIFLPDEDSSLDDLYSQLDADAWDGWMAGFEKQRVLLTLPKFTLEYEVTLNDALAALRMGVAFDPGTANFEGMVPREWMGVQNAYIHEVKHKTFLNVNESGTEAAAVTSVEMRITSMPPTFTVDRPFFTAIYDEETQTILFMGSVVDPS